MIEVLLLEDNPNDCEALRAATKDFDNIVITAVTDSAIEARRLVLEHDFNAMIVDLELPDGDGASFIYELPTLLPDKRPFVLVTTRTTSEYVLKSTRERGAYIVQKFNKNYTPNYVLQIISRFAPYGDYQCDPVALPTLPILTPEEERKRAVLARMRKLIESFGGASSLDGYCLIVDTVIMFMESPNGKPSLSKQVYPVLESRYGKAPNNIEHVMRYFIETLWNSKPKELLREGVPCSKKTGKCTILQFCSYLANRFRDDYI